MKQETLKQGNLLDRLLVSSGLVNYIKVRFGFIERQQFDGLTTVIRGLNTEIIALAGKIKSHHEESAAHLEAVDLYLRRISPEYAAASAGILAKEAIGKMLKSPAMRANEKNTG